MGPVSLTDICVVLFKVIKEKNNRTNVWIPRGKREGGGSGRLGLTYIHY